MKAGWQRTSFARVCSIESALVDPREPPYSDLVHGGGANIESENGTLIDLKTAREEGLKSGRFKFDDSMVLYSKIRLYLMKVVRPDFEGLCSADIYPLSPKTEHLNRDFLYHLLLSPDFTEFAVAGSARAGMPKVNRDHLFSYELDLPPALRAAVDRQLDEICGFQNGFAFKSSTFKPSGCAILRISKIQDGKVDTEKLVFFDLNDYREDLDRYRIVPDDLLIAMSGATTGKIGFNTENTVFYLNQRVGKFEPSKKLNKRFLYHFLSTKVGENRRISAGAAQPNLSTEQIKGFYFRCPQSKSSHELSQRLKHCPKKPSVSNPSTIANSPRSTI